MDPVYLHVPPEDYTDVKALGASWDEESKRWYLPSGMDLSEFSRWLLQGDSGEEFTNSSDEAYVVLAHESCQACHEEIDVICLYCRRGTDFETGDPQVPFSMYYITAMDEAVTRQLELWPSFKQGLSHLYPDFRYYANHCSHCGALQEDELLHSEPEGAFYTFQQDGEYLHVYIRLEGRIRVSGDTKFEV